MFEIILFSLVCLCGIIIVVFRLALPELAKRDPEPISLDYARSFFPVLLLVFLLRGFVAEPFRIPSGSMLPTLEIGDFILVNKFTYGIRLPILHTKVLEINQPERGDIMVFRYPGDNKTNYIKRLVGLPGDVVRYEEGSGKLYVNSVLVDTVADGSYLSFGNKRPHHNRFTQTIKSDSVADSDNPMVEYSILLRKAGRPNRGVLELTIDDGHYFMMGDNRDNSSDSRVWGILPDENIVGKAFFVWFHWNGQKGGGFESSRIGTDIQAKVVE